MEGNSNGPMLPRERTGNDDDDNRFSWNLIILFFQSLSHLFMCLPLNCKKLTIGCPLKKQNNNNNNLFWNSCILLTTFTSWFLVNCLFCFCLFDRHLSAFCVIIMCDGGSSQPLVFLVGHPACVAVHYQALHHSREGNGRSDCEYMFCFCFLLLVSRSFSRTMHLSIRVNMVL